MAEKSSTLQNPSDIESTEPTIAPDSLSGRELGASVPDQEAGVLQLTGLREVASLRVHQDGAELAKDRRSGRTIVTSPPVICR